MGHCWIITEMNCYFRFVKFDTGLFFYMAAYTISIFTALLFDIYKYMYWYVVMVVLRNSEYLIYVFIVFIYSGKHADRIFKTRYLWSDGRVLHRDFISTLLVQLFNYIPYMRACSRPFFRTCFMYKQITPDPLMRYTRGNDMKNKKWNNADSVKTLAS